MKIYVCKCTLGWSNTEICYFFSHTSQTDYIVNNNNNNSPLTFVFVIIN